MSNGSNGFKTFLSFLAGTVVGATLGILFAPKSGKETRQDIKEAFQNVGDEVKEKAAKVSEKANEAIGKIKDTFSKKA